MQFEEMQNTDNGRFPVTMTFRCTRDEREVIRRRARETGLSLSTYLRKRATGGRTNQPIQDLRDLNELKQRLGLLKTLVQADSDVRPLLNPLETLIRKMSAKVQ